MKIYKFITQISIAGCMLVGTPMLQGCMDNSLNDPLGKVSEEELGRDGFAANAFFLTLCDYAYPIATENIYNTNESLIGDCYGRYQVMATDKFKGANFATYNAPENWLNWQFADDNVMVLTYGAWNKIKNVTQGTGVNFAWAQILRIATMHRMLDMYGALPYSQISSDKLSAPYDTMEEAYHAMFTDLTDAINVMTVYVTENPNNRTMAKYDKVYDGDFEKWVKFANSLKLRMAIRIRFADREYARQMAEEAINHSIGVITSNEDNATSLGTKNQLYTVLVQWPDQCVSADITSYMKGYNDPRMSKYFKKKTSADMNDKEIVFSKSIKAGKRIYYLDVKKNRKDEMFLAITESKKVIMGEGDDSQVSFEKHKIFLYREDFQKFMAGLTEAIDFIDRNDMNDYISRLTQEADMEKEQAAIEEEAKEEKKTVIGVNADLETTAEKVGVESPVNILDTLGITQGELDSIKGVLARYE